MLIKVKVFPKSKLNEVVKKNSDSFLVRVKQQAKDNKANNAVFSALSNYFNIPIKRIKLVKGARQRNKIFDINI